MPDISDTKSECVIEVSRYTKKLSQPNLGLYNNFRNICITGNYDALAPKVKEYIDCNVKLCQPDKLKICDGTDCEADDLMELLQRQGTVKKLRKYDNCWLALTNPKDVARVESKTVICTKEKRDTQPDQKEGVKNQLANWISPEECNKAIEERFTGCMKGRVMYAIPFSMGPVGSPYSKIGIELTDSPYVVASMRIMTRIGNPVIELLKNPKQEFVKCLHSVGAPKCGKHEKPSWPCDPERTMIMHKPECNEIISYGSGYGGNSLLGKKCFALRIGSTIAKREGWLAEHMVIMGVTNPQGKKFYITAAFPSACGKTNLAMMTPSLPGYKIECVGDDIAWMKFDASGQLHAINPENGFFGVAPGTSCKTNPIAMKTIFRNTIFTNVAETCDGGVYWEGLEDAVPDGTELTDWLGQPWVKGESKTPAAHPNSRFCTPAKQCPIIDPEWESPNGVPITGIVFGGRRPEGVPLVYESLDWDHGVLVGASVRSEATAAAEHKTKAVMNDPFAMRPFFGYNFGHYLAHWISMKKKSEKLPKIFHVNWFRKNAKGEFLWPGFGQNIRVMEWILKRIECDSSVACETPIGYLPTEKGINLEGLKDIDMKALLDVPKEFWTKEINEIEKYLDEQVGKDVPREVRKQLELIKGRLCLAK